MLLRRFYTFLFYLAFPFLGLRIVWRKRHQSVGLSYWRGRLVWDLTHYPALEGCVWIQATSVGETQAAAPLVKALKAQCPHVPIVVTNTTNTGRSTAKQLLGNAVIYHHFPLDIPRAINAFIAHFKPRLLVIMETDLWPNLLHCCAHRNIPVILGNARLSPSSAKRYCYAAPLIRSMLNTFHTIAAQTSKDAQQFMLLGAKPEKVTVAGNLKCNALLPQGLAHKAQALKKQLGGERKKIVTLASAHIREMPYVLNALKQLKASALSDTLIVLAPRKPEEFDGIAQQCSQAGFSVTRYSESLDKNRQEPINTEIFMLDTLGQLLVYYAASDIVFVAGSLVSGIGGHSLIEPALLKKPIITGAYVKNWVSIAEFLTQAQALCTVSDADNLALAIRDLLQDPMLCKAQGERAYDVIQAHKNALEQHLSLCVQALLA